MTRLLLVGLAVAICGTAAELFGRGRRPDTEPDFRRVHDRQCVTRSDPDT